MRVLGRGLAPLRIVAGLTMAATLTACLSDSGERAERDRTIGRGRSDGFEVSVDGGLAHVRAIDTSSLQLWSQAPVVAFELSSTSTTALGLTLQNIMPGSVLDVRDAAGAPVTVAPATWLRPTAARWQVPLATGERLRVTVAPPDAAAPGPYRFAVLSDVQEALSRVGDIYRRMNGDPSLRFVFNAGDLTDDGSAEELLEFQTRLEELTIPFYGTVGNHELITPSVPWFGIFGRANLHWTFKGVHFTLVDSGSAEIANQVYRWLDGWMAEGRDAVHIFGTHIPPIDPVGVRGGGFNDRNEGAALIAKLARAKVDLAIYGHIHSYYAYTNAGVPTYISGGGGAIPERFDGIGRHYLTVNVHPMAGVREVALVRVGPPN
ncbi:MAG TPA: metallophosphoesterase [Polyangia bacterium]